ncbi:MAG: hypothetical protein A2381_04095 [Bdellovibrionales bacterium RIFOXYB1_FULL_37_110]|nr:MAG: hypothetical protein A2417_10205 [Bdellovibrionales bacterium RIFOXYC1_FULL_37_79]OFZ59104.1 MAG: hypothetical protein A2381_04095 [Bdellovibrionales bacterium RIFOXYB1_FULL_37_110]OFZ64111.1 MAG: hypothetical protein A2577_15215 [Bdellovibrionales bacterium RIFOXYD1_FULL_36_51]
MKLSTLIMAFVLIVPFANSSDYFNSPLNEHVVKTTTTLKCYNYFIELSIKADITYMKVKVNNDFTNGEFITQGPATLMLSSEFGGSVIYNLSHYSLSYSIQRAEFDYFKTPSGSEIRNCKVL